MRQSYADQLPFCMGVSVFMYADGNEKEAIELTIDKPADWKNIEVALPIKKGVIHCDNYDLLADSPIAIGNFEVLEFESQKVTHQIVMIGQGNYDKEKVKKDFNTICDETGKINGENPCKDYIHFIQNVENAGGGLKHLNSQTGQMFRRGIYG
jgi:predicted metalloprotease with PDZ domain